MSFTIEGKENINLARLLTLKAGLKIEIAGMKVTRGRTCYSMIKDEFNLKGNKQKVLEQSEDIINEMTGEVY